MAFVLFAMAIAPLFICAKPDSLKTHWSAGVQVNTLGNQLPYASYNYGFGGLYESNNVNTIQINDRSFSAGITANYYLKNGFSLKISFGYKNYSTNSRYLDTSYYSSQEYINTSQLNYYLAVGCQQDLKISKFVSLHAGIDLSLLLCGKLTQIGEQNQEEPSNLGYLAFDTTVVPGGIAFGVGLKLGVTFKLLKHLGIDAEISQSLMYENFSGNSSSDSYVIYVNSPSYFSHITSKALEEGFVDSGTIMSLSLIYIH